MRKVLLSCFILAAAATPRIALPFNAQVPSVARVGRAYNFTFAASTFTGAATYALVDQPAWLKLDGRTLSGTPSSVGATTFAIRASDSTGSVVLGCTLVVTDKLVRIADDVSQQTQGFGRLSAPSTLALHPGDSFAFAYKESTFTGDVRQKYAISADRTPLPAWLGFDPNTLAFFGVAPGDGVYPITLIASSVIGFSDAEITLTIQICRRCLYFEPQSELYAGAGVALLPQLRLDGVRVRGEEIAKVSLQGSSGLMVSEQGLLLSGTGSGTRATVTVRDVYGNVAVKTLVLSGNDTTSSSVSTASGTKPTGTRTIEHLDDVTVQIGGMVRIELPSIYAGSQVSYSPPQQWLSYQDNVISGTVPSTAPAVISASAVRGDLSALCLIKVAVDGSPSASPSPSVLNLSAGRDQSLSGATVGAIVGSILGAIAIAGLVVLCLCLRKRRTSNNEKASPPTADASSTDSTEGMIETRPNPPPQVSLQVPAGGMIARLSTQSSLGSGEEMIRADRNIPIWSEDSQHRIRHNYAAASQMADPSIRLLPNRYSKASVDGGNELKSQQGSIVPPTLASKSNINALSRNQTTTSKRSSLLRPITRPLSWYAMENRRSIRLVQPSTSTLANRPLAEARQSFIRNRASSGVPSPLFSTGSRDSRHGSFLVVPHKRHRQSRSRLSSEPRPPPRHSHRLAASNAPSSPDPSSFPRTVAIDGHEVRAGASELNDGAHDRESLYSDTSSEITELDMAQTLADELRKPRHLRNWVLPGEASPTPPPATPPTVVTRHGGNSSQGYRQVSELAGSSVDSREAARRKWGARLGRDVTGQITEQPQQSSSPLWGRGGAADELDIIEPLGQRAGMPKSKVPGHYWSGRGLNVARQRSLLGNGRGTTGDGSSSPGVAFL